MEYSQDRRQKKRAMMMRSEVQAAKGEASAAAAKLMTRPSGMAFSRLEGGS